VGDAIHHDVEPGFQLVVAARPDLNLRWHQSLALALEGKAEHVLERHEPIASLGQQGADRGVGVVRELYLHGGAAGGEGALDLVERGRARLTAEAEPATLVNGEPSSAKIAAPPAIGITKPAASLLRRSAASLALAMSSASTRSMRSARAVSQKSGKRSGSCAERSPRATTGTEMAAAALDRRPLDPRGSLHPAPPDRTHALDCGSAQRRQARLAPQRTCRLTSRPIRRVRPRGS
jgi:hypothetical protein